jgi:hypothetical protein
LTGWSIPNFPGRCSTCFSPSNLWAASLTRLVEVLAVQSLPGRLKGAAPRLGPSKRAQGLGRGKPATFSRRAERSVLELTGRARIQLTAFEAGWLAAPQFHCEGSIDQRASLGCTPPCGNKMRA